jgi:GNAT superfamily N-acetyltransferase
MNFFDFYNHHVPALEADAARHYLLLDAFLNVARFPSREFRAWNFGGPGACAIQPAREWTVLLGDLNEEQAHVLANDLAASEFPGVMGAGSAPDWFAARAKELGVPLEAPLRNRMYVLDGHPRFPAAPGAARIVTAGDTALFSEWVLAYVREAFPWDPPPPQAWLERSASHGRYMFWTVDGEPVAVGGIGSELNGSASVSTVYVPPPLRGRGYGGAVTASIAERIRGEGRENVFLMANAENAPALRSYDRIGFRCIGDFTRYWRLPA